MNSVDEILDFAIAREQEAVDFYADLAGRDDLMVQGVNSRALRVTLKRAGQVVDR